MINVSLLDFNEPCGFEPKIPVHQSEIKARIDESSDKSLRQKRLISYSFLLKSYAKIYKKEPPLIVFSELGKPSFAEGNIKVSLSHTDGFCAVAFSEKEVGVDIETTEKLEKNSRSIARFVNNGVKNALKSAKKADVMIDTCVLKNGIIRSSRESFLHTEDENDAHLWCALEAALKCKEGFSAYPRIAEICRAASISTLVLKEKAVLSVASLE